MPTLAVVTPSYNTGRYIGDAVRSVLRQDYPRVDYMVMDGGSKDGTVDVLRSFGPRLRWVSQKDKGQSDAINRGFARTRGDVLGWLNSDDTYAPGAFRAVAERSQRLLVAIALVGCDGVVDAAELDHDGAGGLALLEGSSCPHYDGEAGRRQTDRLLFRPAG